MDNMDNTYFSQSNSRSMRRFNIFQYLFTGIGVFALLLFFSLVDADDIKAYWFMLVAIALVFFQISTTLFAKRATWIQADILITEHGLLLKGLGESIFFDTLTLDIYSRSDGSFSRYHLWDTKKTLAIFSAEEDDLLKQLTMANQDCNINLQNFTESEVSHNRRNHEITVLTEEDHTFLYNIDTGRYSFKSLQQDEPKSTLPKYYVYDPDYTAQQQ